jgi:hypothetical protein
MIVTKTKTKQFKSTLCYAFVYFELQAIIKYGLNNKQGLANRVTHATWVQVNGRTHYTTKSFKLPWMTDVGKMANNRSPGRTGASNVGLV